MQRLIEQLQGRESRSTVRRTSLADLAKEACARCGVREPVPVCGDLDRDAVVLADPERLTMMVEHLLRNAQDATEAGGAVRVDVTVERDVEVDASGTSGLFPVLSLDATATVRAVGEAPASRIDVASLSVVDTGCGMSPEFIKERLFRPFDSTKGSKGMGIGAYQVREYIHSIGGRLRVTSSPGEGTIVIVKLPVQL